MSALSKEGQIQHGGEAIRPSGKREGEYKTSAVPALREKRKPMNRIIKSVAVWALCTLASTAAFAQCQNKSGFAKKVCEAQMAGQAPNAPLSGIDFGDTKANALTTSFADTIHLDTLPPTIEPKAFKPLTGLDRTDDGAFILKVGMYEAYVQSYTLDMGDINATKPGGYYPAPIKGTKAKIVASLLKQVELHPDVPQPDIQNLILAIVQNIDLEKMPPQIQQTAARVLPRDTLMQMQGATQAKALEQTLMGLINQRLSKDKNAMQNLQKMKDAQAQMQQNAGQNSSPDFHTEAVMTEPVARGTWAEMPGGFYVRYLPDGYAKTRLQLIVPSEALAQADPKSPLTFDPTQYLAVLGIAPGERIGITLRPAR